MNNDEHSIVRRKLPQNVKFGLCNINVINYPFLKGYLFSQLEIFYHISMIWLLLFHFNCISNKLCVYFVWMILVYNIRHGYTIWKSFIHWGDKITSKPHLRIIRAICTIWRIFLFIAWCCVAMGFSSNLMTLCLWHDEELLFSIFTWNSIWQIMLQCNLSLILSS